MVNIQENRRIQKQKREYKRKEGYKRGISGTTKNNHQYKPVLSPCFKVVGMNHPIF